MAITPSGPIFVSSQDLTDAIDLLDDFSEDLERSLQFYTEGAGSSRSVRLIAAFLALFLPCMVLIRGPEASEFSPELITILVFAGFILVALAMAEYLQSVRAFRERRDELQFKAGLVREYISTVTAWQDYAPDVGVKGAVIGMKISRLRHLQKRVDRELKRTSSLLPF